MGSPATISRRAVCSGPDLVVEASIRARSASLFKPSENFGPEIRTRVAANKCREVLQPNPRLAGIFYDAKLLAWHFIEKCLDGARRDHRVGRVDNCQNRNAKARRAEILVAKEETTFVKAVFAIKQLGDFADEQAQKRNLIECPSLYPCVKLPSIRITGAQCRIS